MADYEAPNLEDREPKTQDDWEDVNLTQDDPEDMSSFDDLLADDLGEYEFEDLDNLGEFAYGETSERYELLDERQQTLTEPLADAAARTALEWGSRAIRSPQARSGRRRGNGHQSGEGPIWEIAAGQRLPPLESTTANRVGMRACSAAMIEDDALMRSLVGAAAAGSKTEAMAFVAAMVPLSLRAAPDVYRALWAALPALIRGAVGVTKLLHSRPSTRPLIAKRLPAALNNAVIKLAQHARRGYKVTGAVASRTLAKEMAMALQRERTGRSRSRSRSQHAQRGPWGSGDAYDVETW